MTYLKLNMHSFQVTANNLLSSGSVNPPAHGRIASGISALVISGFIAFLFAQHNMVFPYHDDWGYATLSYVGEQTGFTGRNFTLTQLLAFLYGEYVNWSGRFVAFFVQINIFKLGIEYVRLAQVGIILSIVFLAIKLSPQKRVFHPLIIVPIVYFLSLPQYSVAGGLYWFSASVAYVWGISLFLCAAYLIQRRKAFHLISTLLLACAAAFHEQMSFAVVAFVISYTILRQLPKFDAAQAFRDLKLTSPVFLIAIITTFAPGNFSRKNISAYPSNSLTETLTINAKALTHWIFAHPEGRILLAVLAASFVFLFVLLIKSSARKSKPIAITLFMLTLISICYTISLSLFFAATFFAYGALLFLLRTKFKFDAIVLSTYIAAVASLALLSVAPGVAGRSLLTFFFLMMIPVTFIFAQLFCVGPRPVVYAVILAALPFAASNAESIYTGYKANLEVNSVNHAKLIAASHEINHEKSPQSSVTLLKLPKPRYAEKMPYEKPQIEKWMKKYYALPNDFAFLWREQP
ncbi:hypothetical protein SAMN05421783_106166 [Thiocapsa roseopersicina]|uniref:Dolichyl-phosphate-mannose-protein mannosyltransferase n=2 Tax=Thiocapsa roseopersicina TaxID=1058 RepID=A0A1H2V872_THIRO|nr:hypothetical protein SAMN05421783_106166 [Thiocapsa roseopersicina]